MSEVLDVGAAEVAVEADGVVAIYGHDGRLHHALYADPVDHGLFLRDGRLVLFTHDAAHVVDEGVVVRTITTGARAGLPEEIADGLVFDGYGGRPTWIDVDTGEVSFSTVALGVAVHPSGAQITRYGLRARDGDLVMPAGLVATGECRFVPGDARAWCPVREAEACAVVGYTMDGVPETRLPGCTIAAVGPGSIVVDGPAGIQWLRLDGTVAGALPEHGHDVVVGVGGVGWRSRDTFVEAGAGPVRLVQPAAPPLPTGIVVRVGEEIHTLDADGHVTGAWAGLPKAPKEVPRSRVDIRREGLTLTTDGAVVRVWPEKVHRACGIGGDLLVTREESGVLTAWDTTRGAQRWRATGITGRRPCTVAGDVVTVQGDRELSVVDLGTGRLVTTTEELRRSEDGRLWATRAGAITTLVDRAGRRYGQVTGDVQPLTVVGAVAVAALQRSGRFVVFGQRVDGLRWERISLRPAIVAGEVVVLTTDHGLVGVDATDGHTRWTWRAPGRPNLVQLGVKPD